MIGGKSPILGITTAQAKALEASLNSIKQSDFYDSRLTTHGLQSFKVYIGMRYWHPLIEDTIRQMHRDGIRRIIALSLYPHYSIATTGSAMSRFDDVIRQYTGMESARISSWFSHKMYIEALVDVIRKGIESFTPSLTLPPRGGGLGGGDIHVLFSAHSLPMSIVESGDPYVNEIKGTIGEVLKKIDIKWDLSYQSKSGPVKWLVPTTEEKIRELAGKGVGNLLVVPISFVSDHIETLYEIDILYKGLADKLNIKLMRAESLNTSPLFIDALKDIIVMKIKEIGWQG